MDKKKTADNTQEENDSDDNAATRTEEEGGREGPVVDCADSPVFKRKLKKRKRVIFDSDDEGEGAEEEVAESAVDEQRERGEVEKNGAGGEEEREENGASEEAEGDGERVEREEEMEGVQNGIEEPHTSASTAAGESGPAAKEPSPNPPANPELLMAPPKRKTARKHTGRVSFMSTPTSSTSPQVPQRKCSKEVDVNPSKSPPAKKRKTKSPLGKKEKLEDSCGAMPGEVEAREAVNVAEKNESSSKEAEVATEKKREEGERKERPPESAGQARKEEDVEEEAMEVGGEEGKDTRGQVKKETTPKRIAKKASSTPGSEKKKNIHPFFGEQLSCRVFFHMCLQFSLTFCSSSHSERIKRRS